VEDNEMKEKDFKIVIEGDRAEQNAKELSECRQYQYRPRNPGTVPRRVLETGSGKPGPTNPTTDGYLF